MQSITLGVCDLDRHTVAIMPPTKGSGSRLSELAFSSPKQKDLSWDPNLNDGNQDRRNGSLSTGMADKDVAKSDEEKTPKFPSQTWSVEERLLALEREISQLNPAYGYYSYPEPSVFKLLTENLERQDP